MKSTILENFNLTLYQSFKQASERSNTIAADKIFEFTFKQIIAGIGKKSYAIVNQLISLPTSYLIIVFNDKDKSNKVVINTSLNFKAISYFFRSGLREREIEVDVPLLLLYYEGVLTFYHYLIDLPELSQLAYAFNEYNQLIDDHSDLDTRFAIEQVLKDGGTQEDAQKIKDAANNRNIVSITHRRATLALKSWIIYLYVNERISEDRFLLLFNRLELHYQFFEDLLDDVIYIRKTESRYYLGLSGWDYEEHENGKIFSPPTPYDWIIYGLCFFMLKGESPHVMIAVILDDRDLMFLPDTVEKVLVYFRDNLNKWQKALGLAADNQLSKEDATQQLLEIFEERSRKITNVFEQIKLNHQARENEHLVLEEISQELVNKFKLNLAEAWKRQCSIYAIFNHNGNKNIKETAEGLFRYGSNLLLPRFRMMFVENNFQQIYGSSDLGANAGRLTDAGFLSKVILSVETPATSEDLVIGIDEQLEKLSAAGHHPDMIIIPPEFSYKSTLFASPNFKRKTNAEDMSDFGTYRDIAVLTFYTRNITNQVIVADFKAAFQLEIYENDQLYERMLHIELKELSKEDIEAEFAKDPNGWRNNDKGLPFNDEQAKLRIATSFFLEIWSEAKFDIKDSSAFSLFLVNL